MSAAAAELGCPFCSFHCKPEDVFCERCMGNLLPASAWANEAPLVGDGSERAFVLNRIEECEVSEGEALEIVQAKLITDGCLISDFRFSVMQYAGSSVESRYTPWPEEEGWSIWVQHDLVYRGLIQAGGTVVCVIRRTGNSYWQRLP